MTKLARDEVSEYHIDYLIHKKYGIPLSTELWFRKRKHYQALIEQECFSRGLLKLNDDLDSDDVSYLVTEEGNKIIAKWVEDARRSRKDTP